MYNIVGFQTHLTFGEQKRVFRMIPGLENAEFFRYGVMHRNTYINSPGKLTKTYRMAEYPALFFAGQMTGVEGYVESASSGFVAGVNAARLALGRSEIIFLSVLSRRKIQGCTILRKGANPRSLSSSMDLTAVRKAEYVPRN